MNRMSYAVAAALKGTLLAVVAGTISCGGDQSGTSGSAEFHDTGREILGDPQAVVANVGGSPVTLAEIDLVARYWVDQNAPEAQNIRSRKVLQQRALDQIVDQVLLAGEAERLDMAVPDSAVEAMSAAWEASFASAEERDSRLAQTNISPELIRLSLRRDLLVRELVQRTIRDTVRVSDRQVAAYYDAHPEFFDTTRVRASHILFAVDPGADADSVAAVRRRAEQVLAQARGGADFNDLVRLHSDCPSRERDGDLGTRRRTDWVTPFADAAFALQPGEISDVVETRFGFHIIQLTERTGAGGYTLDEAREWIRQRRVEEIVRAATAELARRLRAGSRVEIKI